MARTPLQVVNHGSQEPSTRVQVVDDQPTATRVLDALLRKKGFETCAVNDSRKAVRAAREFDPQVILLDIGMPYMDGYEVARRIRREPGLQRTPIVAITAFSHEEHYRRAAEAGIEHQLTKPCDLNKLVDLIERLGHDAPPPRSGQSRESCSDD